MRIWGRISILKVDKKTDANPKGTQSEAGMLPDKIDGLVDKILKLKGKDVNSDTKEFEEEIDRIVYELYSLSEEEIKIIENGK